MLPVQLSNLTIKTVFNTSISRNPGGISSTSGIPGHFLQVTMETRLLDFENSRKLSAWMASFQGHKFKEIVLPVASQPLGSAKTTSLAGPGVVMVDAGDKRRVKLSRFIPGQLVPLAPGDFIRFFGHKKVYEVYECSVPNSQGECWVTLTAPLLRGLTTNSNVQLRPAFCLSPAGSFPEVNQGGNRPQSYTLSLFENWR